MPVVNPEARTALESIASSFREALTITGPATPADAARLVAIHQGRLVIEAGDCPTFAMRLKDGRVLVTIGAAGTPEEQAHSACWGVGMLLVASGQVPTPAAGRLQAAAEALDTTGVIRAMDTLDAQAELFADAFLREDLTQAQAA